ncbi:MAG: hypothetical protein ACREQH_04130 [Candidatus Binatus sp.]
MSRANRNSAERPIPRLGLSAALFAMLAAAMTVGTTGCVALPVLSAIPSIVSFAYNLSKKKSDGDTGTDANAPDADVAAADTDKPAPKLTAGSVCHLIALERPDLTVVELRKTAAGAPEYRELHLQQSGDDARWNPVAGDDTGPNGWRPAVNFLKMDFNPPLTDVIPDTGTCYLAYVPITPSPNGPVQATEFNSGAGDAAGGFSWDGREYQYKVARTLPCLSPSS